jgi:hypothetical protein
MTLSISSTGFNALVLLCTPMFNFFLVMGQTKQEHAVIMEVGLMLNSPEERAIASAAYDMLFENPGKVG